MTQVISAQPQPVVFCITELDPGGAERALVQIVTRLDRNLWQPQVICLSGPGELVQPLKAAGVPVLCLNAGHRWQVSVLWKLLRALRQIRPAIVQTFLFHANILGRIAARLAGVKHVVSGIRVAERRSHWYLRLDRWTEFLVDRHVCVSQGVREFSQDVAGLAADKLCVIPNGVDASRFATAEAIPRSQLGWSDSDFLILFVGRLDNQKGIFQLISAAEQLQPDFPQIKWLLAGSGPEQAAIKERLRTKNLSDTVQLLGRRSNIPELMKTADLLVLPSLWEGLPNVILEAMAAGLPIVTTAVEGISDLLEPGLSAEIVPPQNVGELSAAIQRMLQNPTHRQACAVAAARKLTHTYSWEAVATEYSQLYRQLLETGKSS